VTNENKRPAAVRYQDPVVANAYDRQRFHHPRGRYNNWRLRRLLNKALGNLSPGSVVLDIPCGTGRIDNWLLNASLRVIAADISSEMLAVARQKVRPTASWLGFLRADADHLPLRSHSVDVVLCIRFLHLLDQEARLRVLSEVARVARRRAVVEFRVERRVKAAKRALISWLTRQPARKKMTVSEIADELSRCGLLADHYYFVSRWFSGSVLVMAHCQNSGAVTVRKSLAPENCAGPTVTRR
jgi:ubiquinone/menaquinone biosynthesis C-methylase UbiE